jgi:hypothetical protein
VGLVWHPNLLATDLLPGNFALGIAAFGLSRSRLDLSCFFDFASSPWGCAGQGGLDRAKGQGGGEEVENARVAGLVLQVLPEQDYRAESKGAGQRFKHSAIK